MVTGGDYCLRIPEIDVPRVVGVFGGGAVGMARALEAAGFSMDVKTIRRWVHRNSLPMRAWLMISATHAIRKGKTLDLNKFIKERA